MGLGLEPPLPHHPIVLLLLATLLRRVVQVALRVDAQQVPPHREGHGNSVAGHAVAGHEDGRGGEARVDLRYTGGVGFGARVRVRVRVGVRVRARVRVRVRVRWSRRRKPGWT